MGFIKIKKWFPILLLLLSLSGTLLFYFGKKQLETQLHHFEKPGISISSENTNISFLKRRITFRKTSLHAVYLSDSIHLEIDSLALYGFHITPFFTTKKLQADSLIIYTPDLTVQQTDGIITTHLSQSKSTPDLELSLIRISNGTVVRKLITKDTLLAMQSIHVSLDSLDTAEQSFSYGGITNYLLTANQVKIQTPDNSRVEIEQVELRKQAWKLNHTQLIPYYGKLQYSKTISHQKDWIAATIPNILINKPNINHLKDSTFKANMIDLKGLELDIFRDKLLPRENLPKPMLTQLLKTFPFKMVIDSITIEQASITYGERVHDRPDYGSITVENISTTVERFNTVENDTLQIHFDAHIKESGIFTGSCFIPLASATEEFWMNIYMHNIQFDTFNSFTETNMNISNSGMVNNAYIAINGNNQNANGRALVNYEDFKLSILNKKTGRKKKVLSEMANLLVRTKRDQKTEKFFSIKRKQDRSFLNYMWLCTEKAMLVSML